MFRKIKLTHDTNRDIVLHTAWHCVTQSVTVTRDVAWQVKRKGKTLVGGCSLAVSCLAPARTFSPPLTRRLSHIFTSAEVWNPEEFLSTPTLSVGPRRVHPGVSPTERSPPIPRNSPSAQAIITGFKWLAIHYLPWLHQNLWTNKKLRPRLLIYSSLCHVFHLWYPFTYFEQVRMRFWASGWCHH